MNNDGRHEIGWKERKTMAMLGIELDLQYYIVGYAVGCVDILHASVRGVKMAYGPVNQLEVHVYVAMYLCRGSSSN